MKCPKEYVPYGWVAALVVGLAGCGDPKVGTIKADRKAVLGQDRSGPTLKATTTRPTAKRPNVDDISPRFKSGETRP